MAGEAARCEDLDGLLISPDVTAVQVNHDELRLTSLDGVILLHNREEEVLHGLVDLDTVLLSGHVDLTDVADNVGEDDLTEMLVADKKQVEEEGEGGLGGDKVLGAEKDEILDEGHTSLGVQSGLGGLEDVDNVGGELRALGGVAVTAVHHVAHYGEELGVSKASDGRGS